MEDDLQMTITIWEMTVSIWEMTISTWDILSIWLYDVASNTCHALLSRKQGLALVHYSAQSYSLLVALTGS